MHYLLWILIGLLLIVVGAFGYALINALLLGRALGRSL
jgi:hypothetical protein